MKRNLSDFGSFLKGNDYQNNNKIANSAFFRIIEKLFSFVGKGDILDLIDYFDPH